MRKCAALRVPLLLMCALYASISFAQTRKISGTITDEKLIPLSGATVTVKGSKVVTTTDIAGKFTFNGPANANTLVVSYVGMREQEITIGSGDVITAALKGNASTLTDVVVVGYGTSRKANLTTAQTSVSAREIERTVNTTLEQAIQGRAAGVFITQNTGQPGGGMSVTIRGISSINGNTEPLYVIDGVQIQGGGTANSTNPIAGLNPADIEDVQILQGPSATAIY